MKHLLIFLLLPFSLGAQTTHSVEVGGSTAGGALPYYSPQDLTINVGDEVVWTSVSGTHNVNGSWMHFPDNPEEFLSGDPEPQLVFSHTFTIPGLYQYHCDQQGHAATQFGSITVMEANNVAEDPAVQQITLFPVPANDRLVIDLGSLPIETAEVISVDGRSVANVPTRNNPRIEIDLTSFTPGQYHLRLTDREGRQISRTFRKL